MPSLWLAVLIRSTKVLKVGGIKKSQDIRQAVFLTPSPPSLLTLCEQNRHVGGID